MTRAKSGPAPGDSAQASVRQIWLGLGGIALVLAAAASGSL